MNPSTTRAGYEGHQKADTLSVAPYRKENNILNPCVGMKPYAARYHVGGHTREAAQHFVRGEIRAILAGRPGP
jgi:hypothetical protein